MVNPRTRKRTTCETQSVLYTVVFHYRGYVRVTLIKKNLAMRRMGGTKSRAGYGEIQEGDGGL